MLADRVMGGTGGSISCHCGRLGTVAGFVAVAAGAVAGLDSTASVLSTTARPQ